MSFEDDFSFRRESVCVDIERALYSKLLSEYLSEVGLLERGVPRLIDEDAARDTGCLVLPLG